VGSIDKADKENVKSKVKEGRRESSTDIGKEERSSFRKYWGLKCSGCDHRKSRFNSVRSGYIGGTSFFVAQISEGNTCRFRTPDLELPPQGGLTHTPKEILNGGKKRGMRWLRNMARRYRSVLVITEKREKEGVWNVLKAECFLRPKEGQV